MAHPTKASGLQLITGQRRQRAPRAPRSRVLLRIKPHGAAIQPRLIHGGKRGKGGKGEVRSRCELACWKGHHFLDGRGLHRIFNAAGYRFYRSNLGPPSESGPAFDSNATLPHTPADTYADGTWYVALSYFNGCIDSGFLPLGDRGENYLRIDLSGGAETTGPPAGPSDVRLESTASGAVRVWAAYIQTGTARAEEWAIAYTDDGSTPPVDTPDVTVSMKSGLWDILQNDLPTSGHGKTVKVRVQTRRNDGSWIYSENSTVLTITTDATGPDAPEASEYWPRER